MRYKELINEVDHNPGVIKIPYDGLQTMIYLGLGQGSWGIGYANVNNYVALIGQVGHGIGKSGGIKNRAQQADPDSATKAIIRSKDYEPEYGDDADKIAGQYNTTTGEISINKDLAYELKPGVERVVQAGRASTLVHEMMHRGFDIISRTPELVRVMPEDVVGYWKNDWGVGKRRYYIGRVQASAEHAMIYTHELGPEKFTFPFNSVSFPEFARAIRSSNEVEVLLPYTHLPFCRIDAVNDPNSPIYRMRPQQIYAYWRGQFDLVNEGLASHFQRVGPPRRSSKGAADKRQAAKQRKQGIQKLRTIDLSPIINRAASLMGNPSVFGGAAYIDKIQPVVDEVFRDLPVSESWRRTVAQTIADFVAADDADGLNAYMKKIKSILSR